MAALRSARVRQSALSVHIYSLRRRLKHEAWRILTIETLAIASASPHHTTIFKLTNHTLLSDERASKH